MSHPPATPTARPQVGTANAIAAGWGNMGGGVTHFIMPPLYEGIAQTRPAFEAWRWSFFLPGAIFVTWGFFSMIFARVRRGHVSCLACRCCLSLAVAGCMAARLRVAVVPTRLTLTCVVQHQ